MKTINVTKITLKAYRELLDLGYIVIFTRPLPVVFELQTPDDQVKFMHVVRDRDNKVKSLRVLN